MDNRDNLKKLEEVLSEEYYNFKQNFNIQKRKGIIGANSQDVEDTFHNLLLKVLERGYYDNFQFIDKEQAINYIKKTFSFRKKDLERLKKQDCSQYETDISDDGVDILLYIYESYESKQINGSVFQKLFKNSA